MVTPVPVTGGDSAIPTRADPALVKALARAFRYQKLLDEGRYASISEMAVAERIGVDAWRDVWRMLSADRAREREEGGLRMPKLRDFDAYLRFQRNRYIEALAQRGEEPAAIRKLVERNLGERLDESHVERLVRSAVGLRYVRGADGRRVRLAKRERLQD